MVQGNGGARLPSIAQGQIQNMAEAMASSGPQDTVGQLR